jgi:hypothetical protein
MSIRQALDIMLSMHHRTVTISRPATAFTATIQVSPSNYFRNLAGISEAVIEGREFVVSKTNLVASGYPEIKRGDRITDAEFGTVTISEVREMFSLGGEICGFRIRTS